MGYLIHLLKKHGTWCIALSMLWFAACANASQGSKGKQALHVKSRSTSVIELSGQDYFPDNVAARKDGTLFVGSMWTGQIDKIPSDAIRPVSFVPREADGRTALGLLVDEDAGRLWACYWDYHRFMKVPAQLKSFDLATGDLKEVYDYPKGAICNDLTMDGNRNIYTTCSFTHRIFRLPAGGKVLETWSAAPAFSAGWKEGFTLNGIAWNGNDSIYVTRTDNDGFYRVPIENDGSAGAVQQIAVADTRTNLGYDGIVAIDSDTFLVAEYGTNRLTMIDVTGNNGTKHTVSTELDFPTKAVVVGGDAWVVESQIDHMLYRDKAGPPRTPFILKRVFLPSH